MKFQIFAGSLLAWGLVGSPLAADVTMTPPSGGSVVINSSASTPGLLVAPGRQVQVPGLPSAASYSSVVCFDANGNLGQCTSGVLGTPGPQGALGPAGPAGAKGDKGDKGDTGAKGDKGDTGLTGDKGDAGLKGDRGDAGLKGDRGDTGLKGDKGDKGDVGLKGDKGDTGLKGDKGDAGVKGDKGDTGLVGPAGSGINGMTEARHGCFNATGTVLAGTGFTVGVVGKVYTVTYGTAMGVANYTLVMDARASTGRSLAMGATTTTSNAVLMVGWTEATETVSSICFMAAR